jgi:hypothetical protein
MYGRDAQASNYFPPYRFLPDSESFEDSFNPAMPMSQGSQ